MTATRRRGAELEQAILAAVVAEVTERGYAATTFEGVAARAETSKPVLYRRWSSKADMVIAAVGGVLRPLTAPDTGTLHDDTAGALRLLRKHITRVKRQTILGLLADLDTAGRRILQELLLTRSQEIIRPAIDRARDRGELGDGVIDDRLLSLPFDLARHDLLFTGELPDTRIEKIVADVALPLWSSLAGPGSAG
ncbi:TetR/AcrR family transcriptional regulator [Gordonia sp. CPCC 205515]|uniref:TetR/AcrR family transcriptional regulator n=1 Tax=Gordonia sp. CPCC 205515 TaxID=3140791 RepID=UPI003AF3BB1A